MIIVLISVTLSIKLLLTYPQKININTLPIKIEAKNFFRLTLAIPQIILTKKADMGILICGTGIGISIAANRHKGIRAAILYNDKVAALAREHNDANVAVFGARTQDKNDVVKYLDIFLKTPFSNGERHCRRIAELG